jgi:hypothetical protein
MENFKLLADRIRRLTEIRALCSVEEALHNPSDKSLASSIKDYSPDAYDRALDGLEEELTKFDLDAALDRLALLRERESTFGKGLFVGVGALAEPYLETLIEAMIGQLARRYYVYVPVEVADFYTDPLSKFPRSLFRFPSIKADVEEACRCYALRRYTASVFHSMGILQVGLYSLAQETGASFPFKIQLAEWETVIAQIESKIKKMRELPKSDKKDEDLTFYSNLAVQFRYFKEAWRNHVAHLREEYDKDQAHSIILHVRDFMELAGTRLREIPVAPADC